MARHRWALWAGGGVALSTWLPPVSDGAAGLLWVHTLTHMVLIAGAGPLLAYGLAGILDRRPHRLARLMGHPLVGLAAFNGFLLFWQLPGAVAVMMEQPAVHQLAHLTLLASAVCLWYPVLRPLGRPGSISRIGRVGYLLLAGVPPTIPGMVMVLARNPLYGAYHGTAGMGALEDQQLAGLLLFGTAKLALVTGTLVAIWQLLTPEAEPPDDHGERRDAPIEPPVVPTWLRRLDGPLADEPAVRTRVGARPGARDTPSGTAAGETDPAPPRRAPDEPGRGSPPG